MKNALLMFLSELHLQNRQLNEITYHNPPFKDIKCIQTNEAAIMGLMEKLHEKGETLDKIVAFSTQRTQKEIEYIDTVTNTQVRNKQRDIFWQDILQKYPQLQGKIEYINYDENCSADETVDYVLKMVSKIKEQLEGLPAEWQINTDLTGGMRHTSVIMMSVLHLLKHNGYGIGEALYANYFREDKGKNRLEDVSVIHRMFELVSSTESCLKLANVTEIENYFSRLPKGEKGEKLKDLLIALNNFSDAVKVCRTGKFENTLHQLAESLRAFQEQENKSRHEQLFAQVLEALENEYSEITKSNPSKLDIIEWCLKKEFLQQAMTLFNEWMPDEIVARRLICISDKYKEQVLDACKSLDAGYKSVNCVLLYELRMRKEWIDEQSAEESQNPAPIKQSFRPDNPVNLLREYLAQREGGDVPDCMSAGLVQSVLAEIKKTDYYKDEHLAGRITWETIKEKHEKLYKCLQGKYKSNEIFCIKFPSMESFFQSRYVTSELIYKYLRNANEDFLKELFEIPVVEKNKPLTKKKTIDRNTEENIAFRWEKRKHELQALFDNGVITTSVQQEEALALAETMYWIRNQRNQINHASNNENCASSAILEETMQKTIRRVIALSGDVQQQPEE